MAAAKVKVSSVAGFLAVVPHLLGFYPSRSMVVVGLDSRRGRITLAFRYDLPDPPDPARAREIARHATEVLEKRQIMTAIAAGYGPGVLVTPVAESIRAATRSARITLRDLLRVEDGRYFSYVCQDPGCCPPDGVPFDGPTHPAAAALAAAGMPARPDRAALAESLAPLTGPVADSMTQATQRALRRAEELRATAPQESPSTRHLPSAMASVRSRWVIKLLARMGSATTLAPSRAAASSRCGSGSKAATKPTPAACRTCTSSSPIGPQPTTAPSRT